MPISPTPDSGSNIPITNTTGSSAKNENVTSVVIVNGQGQERSYDVEVGPTKRKLLIKDGPSGSTKFEILVPGGFNASNLIKDSKLLETIIKTSVQKIEKPRFFERDYNFTIQINDTNHINLVAEAKNRGILGFFRLLFSIEPKSKSVDVSQISIDVECEELVQAYEDKDNNKLTKSVDNFVHTLISMYSKNEKLFAEKIIEMSGKHPKLFDMVLSSIDSKKSDVFVDLLVNLSSKNSDEAANLLLKKYSENVKQTTDSTGGRRANVSNQFANLLVDKFLKDPDTTIESLSQLEVKRESSSLSGNTTLLKNLCQKFVKVAEKQLEITPTGVQKQRLSSNAIKVLSRLAMEPFAEQTKKIAKESMLKLIEDEKIINVDFLVHEDEELSSLAESKYQEILNKNPGNFNLKWSLICDFFQLENRYQQEMSKPDDQRDHKFLESYAKVKEFVNESIDAFQKQVENGSVSGGSLDSIYNVDSDLSLFKDQRFYEILKASVENSLKNGGSEYNTLCKKLIGIAFDKDTMRYDEALELLYKLLASKDGIAYPSKEKNVVGQIVCISLLRKGEDLLRHLTYEEDKLPIQRQVNSIDKFFLRIQTNSEDPEMKITANKFVEKAGLSLLDGHIILIHR